MPARLAFPLIYEHVMAQFPGPENRLARLRVDALLGDAEAEQMLAEVERELEERRARERAETVALSDFDVG